MTDAPDPQPGEETRHGRLEARLDDMETRIAFQDDLMATLNEQMAHQEQALQRLWDTNRILREQIKSLREPQFHESADDLPPPHY